MFVTVMYVVQERSVASGCVVPHFFAAAGVCVTRQYTLVGYAEIGFLCAAQGVGVPRQVTRLRYLAASFEGVF